MHKQIFRNRNKVLDMNTLTMVKAEQIDGNKVLQYLVQA